MAAQWTKLANGYCHLWPIIGLANLLQLIFKPLTFTRLYKTTCKNCWCERRFLRFFFDICYFELCIAYYISFVFKKWYGQLIPTLWPTYPTSEAGWSFSKNIFKLAVQAKLRRYRNKTDIKWKLKALRFWRCTWFANSSYYNKYIWK